MVVDIVLHFCSNIEDITRDAGSFDVEEDALLRKCRVVTVFTFNCVVRILLWSNLLKELQNELAQLSLTDELTYQPLYETIEVYIIVSTKKNIHAQNLLLSDSIFYVEHHKLDSSKKKFLSEARLSALLHKVNNRASSDYFFSACLMLVHTY